MQEETRFWAKVRKTKTCWLWTGYIQPNGYGRFSVGGRAGRQVFAHRWAFEDAYGWLPEELDHTCNVRSCVRPSHLRPTTRRENVTRQEHFNRGKTHCPRGHEYDVFLMTKRGPARRCSTCDQEARRRYKLRTI